MRSFVQHYLCEIVRCYCCMEIHLVNFHWCIIFHCVDRTQSMCVCVYIYIYTHTHTYIHFSLVNRLLGFISTVHLELCLCVVWGVGGKNLPLFRWILCWSLCILLQKSSQEGTKKHKLFIKKFNNRHN